MGVNRSLKEYQRWHAQVDAWLILKVSDPAFVYQWREQAEASMRQSGKGGMSQDQVRLLSAAPAIFWQPRTRGKLQRLQPIL